MLIKILDRLTDPARKYVDGVMKEAGDFHLEFTRGSKNRGQTYNSEDTQITLSVSHSFSAARLSDASFVLGWVQDAMLLTRLYGGAQIDGKEYHRERDALLIKMEQISAILEDRPKPDLSDFIKEKAVDLENTPPPIVYAVAKDTGMAGVEGSWEYTEGPFFTKEDVIENAIPDTDLCVYEIQEGHEPKIVATSNRDNSAWYFPDDKE